MQAAGFAPLRCSAVVLRESESPGGACKSCGCACTSLRASPCMMARMRAMHAVCTACVPLHDGRAMHNSRHAQLACMARWPMHAAPEPRPMFCCLPLAQCFVITRLSREPGASSPLLCACARLTSTCMRTRRRPSASSRPLRRAVRLQMSVYATPRCSTDECCVVAAPPELHAGSLLRPPREVVVAVCLSRPMLVQARLHDGTMAQ